MKASAFLVFLGMVAAIRIGELWVSRKNAQRFEGTFEPQPEPLFKWMVVVHSLMYILLPLELWLRKPDIGGWLTLTATLATFVAFLLRFWTLRHIGKSWNVRILGGETYPICSEGPYQWVRHPNYLVVMLEIFWIPLIAHLWMSCLLLTVLNGFVLSVRIQSEERVLFQNPEWVAKMAPKPRFLPRFW